MFSHIRTIQTLSVKYVYNGKNVFTKNKHKNATFYRGYNLRIINKLQNSKARGA